MKIQSHSKERSGVAGINIEISDPLGLCQQLGEKAFKRIQIWSAAALKLNFNIGH